MNVVGIIAEYNPFHSGHAYQIEILKKQTHAEYVIIAMSGNFVQRGAPALTDKYNRTRMALSCGADLVLELPVLCATASAEYFARGGVSLLHNTGVITHLGYGTECENPLLLTKTANVLTRSPAPFSQRMQKELKAGISYPLARAKALEEALASDTSIDPDELHAMLASPNNILAIEYLKALSLLASPIEPISVLRKGKGYHDTHMKGNFCSASAIRSYLLKENPDFSLLMETMPKPAFTLLRDYPHPFLYEDDFSSLIHYKLLTETPEQTAAYADSSRELANRMYHKRHSFVSYSQFCKLLKSKNTTYTRISRLLLHLLLNIKASDYTRLTAPSPIPYLRVLGFKKSAAPLLSSIKRNGNVPIITSPADASSLISPFGIQCLERDIYAADIYNLVLNAKGACNLCSDYKQPLIVL